MHRRWMVAALLLGCSRTGDPPTTAATVVVNDPPTSASPRAKPPSSTPPTTVHGSLTESGGHRILRVWGSPTQMGHAHGYLLRDSILDVVENYALSVVPPSTLAAAGATLTAVADIPTSLREEAAAIVDGMRDAGGADVAALDRELTAADLLALNAMTDLVAIGCSSVSAWGDGVATGNDGAPMVVRNLDWSDDPDLLENQVILVVMPSDPQQQAIVSIGFAGYIGCLSCMNEAGVTALFNMGYGDGAGSLATAAAGFAPANLLLRDALSVRDVDGDHASTAADVEAAVVAARHVGSYIVHVVQPEGSAPARVLEVESDGVATRGADASLGAAHLAATNHLRAKAKPSSCSRYREIARQSRATERFDTTTLWTLGRAVRLSEVVHTVLFEPRARRFALWLRRPGERADVDGAPTTHAWTDLVARE